MYVKFWKRFFDIVLSVIGLIVAAIPMAIVAIAIKWDSPGPVIFKQQRLGRYGKVYTMYKFRSMCNGLLKPIRLQLPFNTFHSCGNSSRLVLRIIIPTRLIRVSLSSE